MVPSLLLAGWVLAQPLAATPGGTVDAGGWPVVYFATPRPHWLPVLDGVVIVLAPGAAVPVELAARARPLGGRSWRLPSTDPIGDARVWSRHASVEAADPDVLLPRHRHDFDDPSYGGQWYLEELGMDELYEVSLGDPSIRAAVIDSAIEIGHPDLEAAVLAPFDAASDDDDPSPNPGEFCLDGSDSFCDDHGTSVSGIVAARANNGIGIVGLCPECRLVPIKLLAEGGSPLSADVSAFEHAIEQDVAVINNSWGYNESIPAPQTLAAVIRRAATEPRGGLGALVVFAAGNDDRELYDDEVEALPEVLCVSAVDSYGNPTAYTNSGATVDVSAPSATVTLTVGGGITTTFGGTSAAAPVVSGLAAWIASVAPELSAQEIMDLLVETAAPSPLVTPDENGHHDVYGYGIIDPHAVLERLTPPEDGPDAGPVAEDAGPDAALDAGVDAGAASPGDSGCSCRAAGDGGRRIAWVCLALVVACGRRRTRQRQS